MAASDSLDTRAGTVGTAGPLSPGDVPVMRRASLREQVRQAVEELIVFGRLAPGEHLAEESLAELLGVSRQPVREALQSLSVAGFVDLRAGRGAFVHEPTAREAREVFHVRALLESDSCRLAAQHVDDDGVRRLEAIYAEGHAASQRKEDPRRLIELNRAFHRTITEIGGNRVSLALLADLERRAGWYLATIISNRAPSSWAEHRAILDAVAARDPGLAHDLMLTHIDHSRDLLEFTGH
ncbi:GntR family transcriptional regulator [Jiangella alkaliphila]|uniref:DNA-binding transcriptional regulator, GntR family n=1 Tax=Jiangella alkaliphila TaxID=419479 RepID=A0A1H2JWY9_9ACTN|nr:GntR family transcriptional regulator [Jiangella alkaliphila]SDU60974.1 DNA-binding transcriptional regulator, GntR family [Jiangella alkaliphila]